MKHRATTDKGTRTRSVGTKGQGKGHRGRTKKVKGPQHGPRIVRVRGRAWERSKRPKVTDAQQRYRQKWYGAEQPKPNERLPQCILPGGRGMAGYGAWTERPLYAEGNLRGCLNMEAIQPWSGWASEKVRNVIVRKLKKKEITGRALSRHMGVTSRAAFSEYTNGKTNKGLRSHWGAVVYMWWLAQREDNSEARRTYISRHKGGGGRVEVTEGFIKPQETSPKGLAKGWYSRPTHETGQLKGLLHVEELGNIITTPAEVQTMMIEELGTTDGPHTDYTRSALAIHMGINFRRLSHFLKSKKSTKGCQAYWTCAVYVYQMREWRKKRGQTDEANRKSETKSQRGPRKGNTMTNGGRAITNGVKYPGWTTGGYVRFEKKRWPIVRMQHLLVRDEYKVKFTDGTAVNVPRRDMDYTAPGGLRNTEPKQGEGSIYREARERRARGAPGKRMSMEGRKRKGNRKKGKKGTGDEEEPRVETWRRRAPDEPAGVKLKGTRAQERSKGTTRKSTKGLHSARRRGVGDRNESRKEPWKRAPQRPASTRRKSHPGGREIRRDEETRQRRVAEETRTRNRRRERGRPPTVTTQQITAANGQPKTIVLANQMEKAETRYWGLIVGAPVKCYAYLFGREAARNRHGASWRTHEYKGVIQCKDGQDGFRVRYDDGTEYVSNKHHLELQANMSQYNHQEEEGQTQCMYATKQRRIRGT